MAGSWFDSILSKTFYIAHCVGQLVESKIRTYHGRVEEGRPGRQVWEAGQDAKPTGSVRRGDKRPSCPRVEDNCLECVLGSTNKRNLMQIDEVQKTAVDYRLMTDLSAGRRLLFVSGCRPVYRRLFVSVNGCRARHVREFSLARLLYVCFMRDVLRSHYSEVRIPVFRFWYAWRYPVTLPCSSVSLIATLCSGASPSAFRHLSLSGFTESRIAVICIALRRSSRGMSWFPIRLIRTRTNFTLSRMILFFNLEVEIQNKFIRILSSQQSR